MLAWPSDMRGLMLQLPQGWYELPYYMPVAERRRLVGLLCAGIEALEYVVEIEWGELGDDSNALRLSKSVVVLSVPAGVGEEALDLAKAQLGSVRVGLVHYGESRLWADVAWQERHIKVPLLSWIKRQLADPSHPFAQIGVASLPVDQLAKLTPEPVEMLVMVEKVLAHQLEYRSGGAQAVGWMRAVWEVVADRLALRLGRLPTGSLPEVLDRLRAPPETVSVMSGARVAGVALAEIGLAWQEGSDVLLGPLTRAVQDDEVFRRLGSRLPEAAWSPMNRRMLARITPPKLLVPRAALLIPEPNYAKWPAVTPFTADLYSDRYSPYFGRLKESFRKLKAKAEAKHPPPMRPPPEPGFEALSESIATLRQELDDDSLIAVDFERGRMHRFDAVDRLVGEGPQSRWYRALARWLGISHLLHRPHPRPHLEILKKETELAIELAGDVPRLTLPLQALAGDIHALLGNYTEAVDSWQATRQALSNDRSRVRINLRCVSAWLRQDDDQGFAWFAEITDPGHHIWVSEEARAQLSITHFIDLGDALESGTSATWLVGLLMNNFRDDGLSALWAAGGLELEDWPLARHYAWSTSAPSEPAPGWSQILRAYIAVHDGHVSRGAAIFDEVQTRAHQRGDRLIEALALRGQALVLSVEPHATADPSDLIAKLEQALELEQDLDLPDAALVQLEIDGWRLLTKSGGLSELLERARLLSESASSASLRNAASVLRFRHSWAALSNAKANGAGALLDTDLTAIVSTVKAVLDRPNRSVWLLQTVRHLSAYAAHFADSHPGDLANQTRQLAHDLASDDDELLTWLLEPGQRTQTTGPTRPS